MGSPIHQGDAEGSPHRRGAGPGPRLAEIAAAQHGVVSRAQLARIGVGRGALDRWVQAGRLHRVHRGVYAVGHPRLGRRGRWLAAAMACGPGAALSNGDAAALWELREASDRRVHVTTPCRSRHGSPGICLHRVRRLDAADVAEREGIPVTTVARTLVDLAAVLGPRQLARAIREADYLRLLDLPAVEAAAARTRTRHHTAALRAALELHRPGKVVRSELEQRFLDLCSAAGLPEPRTNVPVAAAGGDVEVDALWPDHSVVAELDGAAAHATARAFEADRARDAALVASGLRVVRFTWRQVREGEAVVRALRALLGL